MAAADKTPPKAAAASAPMVETAKQVVKQAKKVSESASHLEVSAGAVMQSADLQLASAERRTVLAADRTVLAAERTYAAWVRTGMAGLAGGAAARPLLEDRWAHWIVLLTGTVLLAFAVFCFVAGVWRQLQPGGAPQPDARKLPAWTLVTANAALSAAALAALAEIWLSGG